MMDKSQRRPVIDPLLLALKSRRVVIAITALVVGVLVALLPDLAAVRGELLTLVTTVALMLIGGLSLEDAARAARESTPPDTLDDHIRNIVDAVLDEIPVE